MVLLKMKSSKIKNSWKPFTRKFEKQKVHSSIKDNIWCTELADMQLISKSNKEICFLLCVNDIYSKYAWVICLKDKKRH